MWNEIVVESKQIYVIVFWRMSDGNGTNVIERKKKNEKKLISMSVF